MEGVGTLGMWPVKRKKEKEKITDLAEMKVTHSPAPSSMKQSEPH